MSKDDGRVYPPNPRGMLLKLAFDVDEIFDVGVRFGTKWLYDAFPEKQFFLVDPQPEGERLLTYKPRHFEFVNVGVGAAPGFLKLIEHDNGVYSGFLKRTSLTAKPVKQEIEVPVQTIDEIFTRFSSSNRIGLKIDTEGFEFEALRGMNEAANKIKFVVAEVSVRKRFEGGYNFSELVALLLSKGFVFLTFLNRPSVLPRFYDCLFVPEDDPRLT